MLSTRSSDRQQRSASFQKEEAQYRAARKPRIDPTGRYGDPTNLHLQTKQAHNGPFGLLVEELTLFRWSQQKQLLLTYKFSVLRTMRSGPTVKAVNQRKTPGPDGVHWCVSLKDYADQLAEVLKKILNQSTICYPPFAKKYFHHQSDY